MKLAAKSAALASALGKPLKDARLQKKEAERGGEDDEAPSPRQYPPVSPDVEVRGPHQHTA